LSAPDEDYAVGYCRPPMETQWKKGQSGNGGPKKRKSTPVATVEIIDRLLGEPIEIVETGVVRKVSTLEAILMRLWAAEISGSKRAGGFDCSSRSLSRRRIRNVRLLLKRSAGSSELGMADYEIGYGKPPRHSQFKKGVCANPSGRPRRRNAELGDVVRGFLSAEAQYCEHADQKYIKIGIDDQATCHFSVER
jgi:Family of unknown function (DUF5681)